ncbi:MAG: exportin 1 [Amphiamblys sp. WSBS2006]|nr:MAG: exportin 1 [Amphiamblys sp. WSBS2006]
MEDILSFDKQLDIALFDRVADMFFGGHGQSQADAQKILAQFQAHPDAWQRADYILENSKSTNAKFVALQILEGLVQTRWNTLPQEQRTGIRGYVVTQIIRRTGDEGVFKAERVLVNKLNVVLVQILKHEWPRRWAGFIEEIVGSSRTNITLCENNITILRLLSEEIFSSPREQMTTLRSKGLKEQLSKEFSIVFSLCLEIIENAQKATLIANTLQTVLLFLRWIPLGYIFETTLVPTLVARFVPSAQHSNTAIKCLTEAMAVYTPEQHGSCGIEALRSVLGVLEKKCPHTRDMDALYQQADNEEQQLLQNTAIFLQTIFSLHLPFLERSGQIEDILLGHFYLLRLTLVDEREMFKTCLAYWAYLAGRLYNADQTQAGALQMYSDTLSQLRVAMIDRMAKPEEVIIVEDENGEVVRERTTETDALQIYQEMRSVLVYLTHLNPEETGGIMKDKLQQLFDDEGWSWNRINKVCWAIGSVSGAMDTDLEKRFVVTVIRDLLSLCEMRRGKDNKAIVAGGIMYVIGQYPRFLRQHWKFLKTVVHKLFEFMHETHEGVQDMACDTFLLLGKKCGTLFLLLHSNETQPFIDEILAGISATTASLSAQQTNTFIETVAAILRHQPEKTAQAVQIGELLRATNAEWERLVAAIGQNTNVLKDKDVALRVANSLRTNTVVCRAIGQAFFVQLTKIFMDMLSIYTNAGSFVTEEIERHGQVAARTVAVRNLRSVKREALCLVNAFVEQATDFQAVSSNLVPPLLNTILADYRAIPAVARESEVLRVAATLAKTQAEGLGAFVPFILDATLETTLQMISTDLTDHPEHRLLFFELIATLTECCFSQLLQLPPRQFGLLVDSIVWAFKHTAREMAELGLVACHRLVGQIHGTAAEERFYRQYYMVLLQETFFVLTDADHKAGFRYQTQILALLIEAAVERSDMFALSQDSSEPNSLFIDTSLKKMLGDAFQHIQKTQIDTFVKGLFDLYKTPAIFRDHIRDFLVSLREFSEGNEDLFLEEAELERNRRLLAEKEVRMAVPGMVRPMDLPDDME